MLGILIALAVGFILGKIVTKRNLKKMVGSE